MKILEHILAIIGGSTVIALFTAAVIGRISGFRRRTTDVTSPGATPQLDDRTLAIIKLQSITTAITAANQALQVEVETLQQANPGIDLTHVTASVASIGGSVNSLAVAAQNAMTGASESN